MHTATFHQFQGDTVVSLLFSSISRTANSGRSSISAEKGKKEKPGNEWSMKKYQKHEHTLQEIIEKQHLQSLSVDHF